MDELDQVRRLVEHVPPPDPGRKAAARDELLALADAEVERSAEEAGPAPLTVRLRDLLAGRWAPALAAATAVLLLVVAVGAVVVGDLWQGAEEEPTALSEPQPAAEDADPGAQVDDAPAAEEEAAPQLADACTDPEGLYRIGYPEGWHTEPDGECRRFDDEPVELEAAIGGGESLAPIEIHVSDNDFHEQADPAPAWRELESEATVVDGRDAVRAVWESTGEGGLEEGIRSYRYLVDLDGRTLIAETRDPEDGTFEERRRVLDEMVATIDLDTEA